MPMHQKETYHCSICNTEINTAESKMMIDRNENLKIKGILCVDCYSAVCRDDAFSLLQAIQYILLGGYPDEFDDDGEVPRQKNMQNGLTEQDRDLLEQLRGYREFTTLRDDEFSIPKLKGRKKEAVPKKKKESRHRASLAAKSREPKGPVIKIAA